MLRAKARARARERKRERERVGDLNVYVYSYKRLFVDNPCPAFEPFRCPEEGKCISIQVIKKDQGPRPSGY